MAKRGRPAKGEVREPRTTGRGQGWRKAYTPSELRAKCDAYFDDCDAKNRKYTRPGLALFLGVEPDTVTRWANDTSERGGEGAGVIKMAFARMADALEQRTDSMAIFLTKQPCYGGYRDRPDDSGDGRVNVAITFGGKAGKEVADYGK